MTRKKIAKEIIISLILITIMFLGFFGLSFLSSNIFEEKENISNEIAELSEQIKNINPLQKLWYDLVKADKFNISFEKFNLQYNGIEKREFLYNLAKNNEFYNGSYDDFNIKYFPNESALKYAYATFRFRLSAPTVPLAFFSEVRHSAALDHSSIFEAHC